MSGSPEAGWRRGYRLVPLTSADGPALERALADEATWRPYSWFGFGRLVGPFGQNPDAPAEGVYQLKVESRDGDLVGRVTWTRGGRYGGSDDHRGWIVGVMILPPFRHSPAAHAAVSLLVDYLFTTTSVHRIESFTSGFASHAAARHGAGFSFEGVIRGGQWRDGRWHDVAVYGVTRPDWEAAREVPDADRPAATRE